MFRISRAIVLAGGALCATTATASTAELEIRYQTDSATDIVLQGPKVIREHISPQALEKNGAVEGIVAGLVAGRYATAGDETKALVQLCTLVNNLDDIGAGPKDYTYRDATTTWKQTVTASSSLIVSHKAENYFVSCRFSPRRQASGVGNVEPVFAFVGYDLAKDDFGTYYDASVADLQAGRIFHLQREWVGYLEKWAQSPREAFGYLSRNTSYISSAIVTCSDAKDTVLYDTAVIELEAAPVATFSTNPVDAYGDRLDSALARWESYSPLLGYFEKYASERLGLRELSAAKVAVARYAPRLGRVGNRIASVNGVGFCEDWPESIVTLAVEQSDPFVAGRSAGFVERFDPRLGLSYGFVAARIDDREIVRDIKEFAYLEPEFGETCLDGTVRAATDKSEVLSFDGNGNPVPPAGRYTRWECTQDVHAAGAGWGYAWKICANRDVNAN